MSRPLLISDCDEVLLHMVVPFRDWLDEEKEIHFDLEKGDFVDALRHKYDGTVVPGEKVWPLLQEFFDGQMCRQTAIEGAVDAMTQISDIADIVILTNLTDERNAARREQLRAAGIDHPVFTNQGGKGEALDRILHEYQPSVAVFVDDLGHQHSSIAKYCPQVWRLQMVGEPILAKFVQTNNDAHARIDSWPEALPWICDKLTSGRSAPLVRSADETIE